MAPRSRSKNQLSLDFDEPDPWADWLARPVTPENRLADLTLQIKRDVAVLKGPPELCVDRIFFEERVAAYQEDARRLSETIHR